MSNNYYKVLISLFLLLLSYYLLFLKSETEYNDKESDEEDDEENKPFNINNKNIYNYVIFGLLCLILLYKLVEIVYNYFKYDNKKYISKKLLKTKDKDYFIELCDKLLKKGNKDVYKQFVEMKKERPISEVNNFCGNYAKIVLNKK